MKGKPHMHIMVPNQQENEKNYYATNLCDIAKVSGSHYSDLDYP